MKKPTIYQIKHGYEALAKIEGKEAHFFDRDTLKCFGETMRTLSVFITVAPDIFIVRTRYNAHYFEAVGDGPDPYFKHLGTMLPAELTK